ncbi:SusE domain-containing protein [Flaviaesturariibacter amylovorans]|uniref:SusE outer membrane protein domain-containing protein n=1 Tax=Flaviaesturariibacter amylovorans TaxID=1084520 RepID=A0ABP8HQI4_9BACT
MKNKSFLLVLSALLLSVLWSCKKQENRVVLESVQPVALTGSLPNNATVPMAYADRAQTALTLNWTNPNYRFNTGLSSQSVSYRIEIDTVGNNFKWSRKQTFLVTGGTSRSFTQEELNTLMLTGMRLVPEIPHKLEIRVMAYIGNEAAMQVSNTLTYTLTPFSTPPAVAPPASGKLFLTGSAAPLSWMSGGDPEASAVNAGQRFTQVSPTKYVINSIQLNGGQSMLFVPTYGDWGDKYGFTGGGNANNTSGDTFRRGGNDIKAPAASGNYKIEVDFQLGTFTVTPV